MQEKEIILCRLEDIKKQFPSFANEFTVKEKFSHLYREINNSVNVDVKENIVDLWKYIDHTNLNAFATVSDVKKLAEEVAEYGFYSACVHSGRVPVIRNKFPDVKVAAVVGFPLGACLTEVKLAETSIMVNNYTVAEIDMVINIGKLIEGDYQGVYDDIKTISDCCHSNGKKNKTLLKVILETGCIKSKEKIIDASIISVLAGADFVKTSTGFGFDGANIADVALMRAVVGPNIGVKASGGIRNAETAKAMISAGASRLGCSSSIQIVKGDLVKGSPPSAARSSY